MYLIKEDPKQSFQKRILKRHKEFMARCGVNLQDGRKYPFSGKNVCGDCGGIFRRRVISGEVIWIYGNHIKGRSCGQALGGKVHEKNIRQAFAQLCPKLKQNKRILEEKCGRFAEMEGALRQAGVGSDIRNRIAGLKRQEQVLSQMLGNRYLDPAF